MRLRHGASRAAARRHPAIDGSQDLASTASNPDWVTERLTPGQIPARRTAPGSVTWRTSAPAGPQATPWRNPAPEPRSAPARPAPDGHHRRAEPAVSQRDPGQRTRLLGVDRTARTASAAGLLANAATVAGRNDPPGEPGGDQVVRVTGTDDRAICAGDRADQRRFRIWNPVSCQQRQSGKMPDPNTFGGPTRPPLLYFPAVLAVRLFEFRF
jgi:hypothetical protein